MTVSTGASRHDDTETQHMLHLLQSALYCSRPLRGIAPVPTFPTLCVRPGAPRPRAV